MLPRAPREPHAPREPPRAGRRALRLPPQPPPQPPPPPPDPGGAGGPGGPAAAPRHVGTGLKRVSFGSSKGSMVETLIYESPLQEEAERSPPISIASPAPSDLALALDPFDAEESERSKVRVSFFQSVRAQSVAEQQVEPEAPAMAAEPAEPYRTAAYTRQASTESGWDNPFQPDGYLAREADKIVTLIRGGKPITPTPGAPPTIDDTDTPASPLKAATPITQSPQKQVKVTNVQGAIKNGTSNGGTESTPGAVDVQLSGPPEPQQPELVLLKKKPKCKCCVIQ